MSSNSSVRTIRQHSRRAFVALAAFALLGCGSDTPTQPPQPVVVAVQPGSVSVTVGNTSQLSASATRGGSPVTTETFTFTIDKPAVATVTAAGTVLGVSVGTATITVTGSSATTATVPVTVTAPPPSIIEKTAGDAQAAIVGSAVAVAPSVTIKDASGKPVVGVSVTFAVASGGGTITGAAQTSNASGVATVGSWVLGSTGLNSLTATVGTLPPATFVATGQAKPGTIVLSASNVSFSATAGAANPAGQNVTVTTANGSVGALSLGAITYSAGATGWLSATLNGPDTPGLVVLSPSITGLAAGTYTATVPVRGSAAANSPQNIVVTLVIDAAQVVVQQLSISQQPGNAASGAVFSTQPIVEIHDGAGNVDVNASDAITVTLNGAGGVLGGTTTVNAVNGVATFSNLKITNDGRYSLTFSAAGIGTVTSNIILIGNASATPSGMVLNVGAAATANVASGANIVIPVIADMTGAQGSLGSVAFAFTWDPTLFDFVSSANGTFGTAPAYFVDPANTATGSIGVNIIDSHGLTNASGAPTIFTVTLKAKASTTGTTVTTNVATAADATGLSLPAGALTVRPLTVTIP